MDLDAAMATLERDDPIGTIADSFPITLGTEGPGRPATGLATDESQDHTIASNDGNTRGPVNGTKPRSTHMRMPVELARRIDRLRDELQEAYSTGRVEIPSTMADRIPAWYVVERALDEIEARRARSNRPRRK